MARSAALHAKLAKPVTSPVRVSRAVILTAAKAPVTSQLTPARAAWLRETLQGSVVKTSRQWLVERAAQTPPLVLRPVARM